MKPHKLLLVFLLFVVACNNADPLDYSITPPDGWEMYDTVMLEREVRIIQGPDSTMDDARPFMNVIVQPMRKSLGQFTQSNMGNLKRDGNKVMIQSTGSVQIKNVVANWFTYTNEHKGVKRECVNYIIPVDGYAYMVTAGVNAGYMDMYAQTFDDVVQTFYCIKPHSD